MDLLTTIVQMVALVVVALGLVFAIMGGFSGLIRLLHRIGDDWASGRELVALHRAGRSIQLQAQYFSHAPGVQEAIQELGVHIQEAENPHAAVDLMEVRDRVAHKQHRENGKAT